FERGSRIIHEEVLRDALAALFRDLLIGALQLQRTRRYVVGIAREEMNETILEPRFRHQLRLQTEPAEQRLRGDLDVTALPEPAIEPLGVCAQERVALGMRDDGSHANQLEMMERLVHGRRDRELVEFNE